MRDKNAKIFDGMSKTISHCIMELATISKQYNDNKVTFEFWMMKNQTAKSESR